MKKAGLVLLVWLITNFAGSTVGAFPNENFFWEQWREYDGRYHHEQQGIYREDYLNRVGFRYRDHRNYNWYGSQRFTRIFVYYTDDGRQQVYRVDARPYSGWTCFNAVQKYHGRYTYFARYQGSRDQAYFWIGRDTIIRLVIGERGRDHVSVWSRTETENYAVENNFANRALLNEYGPYLDDMPPDMARTYLDVLHLHD